MPTIIQNADYYTKCRLLYKRPTIIQKADYYTKGRLLYKRLIIQLTIIRNGWLLFHALSYSKCTYSKALKYIHYDLDVVYVLLTVYICVVCSSFLSTSLSCECTEHPQCSHKIFIIVCRLLYRYTCSRQNGKQKVSEITLIYPDVTPKHETISHHLSLK